MRVLLALALGVWLAPAHAAELPIFDAHIHYSHDAVQYLPPEKAIAILREAGLRRAMVSSSDDDGTQRLHALAPELVIPSLRPYRKRGDVGTWTKDPTVIDYLEARLATYKYRAIGEFHVYGADADQPVVRRAVQLAKQHGLFLHAHSDAEAIHRLFAQDADARILWAHSGFERPEALRPMLQKYPKLWCDLAYRHDHASGSTLDPAWKALFEEFPERFLLGTDTFVPERWHVIVETAQYSRGWLATLPAPLAERIAWRNGDGLFATIGP
jgi:hypothetical protein